MVSWPKGLAPPSGRIEQTVFRLIQADLTVAKQYIPEADLELFQHFKSRHGTSCAHQIATATSNEPERRPFPKQWSQVNDYHLLRPRVPDFFIGSQAQTVVFGVNATS
jgi:hypothetical protein